MKLVSFNVNSVRVRLHQLQAVIDELDPDIIGLQETKVQDKDFPQAEIEAMGYQVHYHGQKTHYGVALLSRQAPERVIKGFPDDGEESQKRWIGARFKLPDGSPLEVYNGYFPQGESRDHPVKFPAKRKFYQDLSRYLNQAHSSDQQLVVMGDMNVAPQDLDVGIGEDNAKRWLRTGKCSFLPEEREWLKQIMDWGLHDTFRHQHPEQRLFSWFDYRSRGFERDPRRGLRIDLVLVTGSLLSRLEDAGISYRIRAMDKPSDHCPVWAAFRF